MRIRSPSDRPPYSIHHSELYVETVFALKRDYPFIDDAVQWIEWRLERNPLDQERCPAFPGRDLFLIYADKTPRAPGLRVLYEVVGDRVYCWQLSVRED